MPPTPPSTASLLREAFSCAARHPYATFLMLPATAALIVGGCLAPLLNFAFILIALAPLLLGLPTVALAIVDEGHGRVPWTAPFAGFRNYERSLGLFWVPYLIAVGASIPLLLALWLDRRIFIDDHRIWLFSLGGFASASILFAVLHRYVLAPFAAIDLDRRLPLTRVLEEASNRLGKNRARIWGQILLISLLGLSGVAAFGVGLLVTAPLSAIAMACLYRRLPGRD